MVGIETGLADVYSALKSIGNVACVCARCWGRRPNSTIRPGFRSTLTTAARPAINSSPFSHPEATTIFILPPSWELLEQRLRGRRTETEAAVQRRLEVARRELAVAGEYQHQIVNRDVEAAVRQIQTIVRGQRNVSEPRTDTD